MAPTRTTKRLDNIMVYYHGSSQLFLDRASLPRFIERMDDDMLTELSTLVKDRQR